MILPNNGKVVIIDDRAEDVKELISVLSKEKVPFVHYKEEDLSDLPISPMENVRLIFLDLELVTDVYVDSKNITAPIKTRLTRVVKPKTPYALVIWSKKENVYREALLNDFDTEFRDYKPIFHTSLPKADIIGREGALEKIKKELESEIAGFKSFNAFLVWEAIINESSGKLTNEITTLYPPDGEWDKKTKFLLYKLAVAYSGKAVDSFTDIKQLKNALYSLTYSFVENIENSIDKVIGEKFIDLVSSTKQEIENFTSVINKLLLISEGNDDIKQPGNLYFKSKEIEVKLKGYEFFYNQSKEGISKLKIEFQEATFKAAEKKYNGQKQEIEEKRIQLRKIVNEITVSGLMETAYLDSELKDLILASVISIELNITPLCDYAQNKTNTYRILPGVMLKSIYRKHLNLSSAFIYVSDADFRIDGEDYLFLFDFRFLYSLEKDEMEGRLTKYRLKQQLLSDVQIKLGAHINRAGVLFVS